MNTDKIRRGYVDCAFGQLHYRTLGDGDAPPLVLMHATAYSSSTFTPLLPYLARDRRVIALDTPGYGESDRPGVLPRFERYAEAMMEAIEALAAGSVDLFGYHTGALLATEMAVAHPASVRQLVLIGIPYFEGNEKAAWRAKLVHEHTLEETLSQFGLRWDYFVAKRPSHVALTRGFEAFVDELKAFPADFWSHRALFDYDAGPRLRRVTQPVLVINSDAPLAKASATAAALMRDAEVIEVPELGHAIFDADPERIASLTLEFLDASRSAQALRQSS